MLKLLLKKQLLESFRGFFVNQKKNTGRAREVTIALILLYALLLVGVIGGFVGFLAYNLCSPLAEAGLLWLYHAIFALIALLLGVFGSVFNTFAGLYKGKDNDLLLSLPIPVRYILASRLLGVYLLGLMFSAAVLLPAYLVRVIFGGFSVPALFGGLLLILLVSLVVFVLSCLLGWVVAKISTKLKNKSFITVFLALGFIALYYVVYFKGLDVFNEMIANPEGIDGEGIKGKAYLFYLLGQIGEGKPLACLVYSLVIFAAVVLTCFVLDRTFIKIATTATATTKKAYVEKRIAMRPLWLTALLREAKRFTSNAGYMLNTGLSTILAPALGIFLLVKGEAYASSLLAREGVTCVLVKPPLDFALLDIDAADGVREQFPEIGTWLLGGHSLGGVAACEYLAQHGSDFDGVVLLASYPNSDLTDYAGFSLQLVGSEDGVVNRDSYDGARPNLPDDAHELVIEGGNHAQFGNYGEQSGDGTASISGTQQQEQTVEAVLDLLDAAA